MTKRLVKLAERFLNAFQSAFACIGLFTLVWMLMRAFYPEVARVENAGIPFFVCWLVVYGVNKALAYLRELMFDFELDEMLELGSKTEEELQEELQAAELCEHLGVL